MVKVTDSGFGMSENHIGSLFKTAQTETSLGTNGEKGTGLGLVLCQEFSKVNGGEITVRVTSGRAVRLRYICQPGVIQILRQHKKSDRSMGCLVGKHGPAQSGFFSRDYLAVKTCWPGVFAISPR